MCSKYIVQADNKKSYDIMHALHIYGSCRGLKNMNLRVLVIHRVN